MTKRIGIDKLFDGIFDIRDSEFIPKPSKEPYEKLVENYKKLSHNIVYSLKI